MERKIKNTQRHSLNTRHCHSTHTHTHYTPILCRVALQAKREQRIVNHELREAARLYVQAVTDKVADWPGPRASQESWTRTYPTPSSLLVRTQSSSQPPECVEWSGLRSDTKREVKGRRQSGRFGESSGHLFSLTYTQSNAPTILYSG